MQSSRSFRRARYAAVPFFASILLLGAACGGGGGSSSPTDPGNPAPPLGTASVEGQVSVNGTGGDLSSGASSLSTVSAPDQSGAGVTVRVQGTDLATTADASGSFRLGGVPHGDQVLVFETDASSAGVPVDSIQPQEAIRLSVELDGSNARVTDIDRDGGDDSEPEPDEEEPEPLMLSLQLSPDTWNTNYENSAGTVTAFIRGQGFTEVILDSIVMVGSDDSAMPLDPVSSTREGNHVRARFAKSDVLDLLDGADPGTVHEVCLELEADGFESLQVLCGDVRIVGPADGGEDDGEDDDGEDEEELGNLSLQLSPKSWNLNYDGASGHVTAFIRGDGLFHVDTDSVELVGDDPAAAPLPASTARLEGNHVRAQFPKNEVLDLLLDPEKNSTHTVTLRFTADDGGSSHELTAQVKIVGSQK